MPPKKKAKTTKVVKTKQPVATEIYNEPINEQQQQYERPLWEYSAESVLLLLYKHHYIDVLNKKVIANFYVNTPGMEESNLLTLG